MKKERVFEYQQRVLAALANRIDDFYLGAGTALSLFYFQHRVSVDLDFFAPHFSFQRVKEIISFLKQSLKKEIRLVGQSAQSGKARMQVYHVLFTKKDILKLDFIEDPFERVKKPKIVDGIAVSTLEDIYIRKLYALVGVMPVIDVVGKTRVVGGRTEAKDFYDIYVLSTVFMPVSKFIHKYADQITREGFISWFRTYDRMQVIDGLLNLDIDRETDYKRIERHFMQEIDKMIKSSLEKI